MKPWNPEDSGTAFFQCWEKTNNQKRKKKKSKRTARILYPVKISFRNEKEIKTSSGERKLREFVTSRPDLKE